MNLTKSHRNPKRAEPAETPVSVTVSTNSAARALVPIRAAHGTGPVHFCVADGPFDLARAAETEEFTLAEIFSGQIDPTRRERGRIGFGG